MHEYRDSLICQEMKALKSDVSHLDLHIASLVMDQLLPAGNFQRVLIVGVHNTLLPSVLGGIFNYVVFALVTPPVSYVERQLQFLLWARQRYGRCMVHPLQSPLKGLPEFGEQRFVAVIVMPDVDFHKVERYCYDYLGDDGVLVVAQKWPTEITGVEKWRKYLKNTDAGYCIETDEEGAEWVVTRLLKSP